VRSSRISARRGPGKGVCIPYVTWGNNDEAEAELRAPFIKHIRQTLQKQQAEDVFLVFRRIHLRLQLICGLKEKGFELIKRDLGSAHFFHIIETEAVSS
jgi:hypothetical protein